MGLCDRWNNIILVSPALSVETSFKKQLRSNNLLSCQRGRVLPVEICLKIVERVIDIDPKSVKTLMGLSRDFRSLLKGYEISITKCVAGQENTNHPVRPSLASPEQVNFPPFSYPWLSEIRFRIFLTDFLARQDISDMNEFGFGLTGGSYSQSGHVKFSVLEAGVEEMKRDSTALLYQLVDSTAGLKKMHSIRKKQLEFLETLEPVELAKLAFLVKALGVGYSKNLENRLKPMIESSIREHVCVFEDKVLRYGPIFAWARVAGTEKAHRWARNAMLEGLKEMECYERGHLMAYASLQSVVWKIFCQKAGCEIADSWIVARVMIGEAITAQKAS